MTTRAPSTTAPEECAEDLDLYDPVTVTRINSDTGSMISPQSWWRPARLPEDEDFPYSGSYLEFQFTPRALVTSLVINSVLGRDEEVAITLKVRENAITDYYSLVDEAALSRIFVGITGTKIYLPPSTPFATGLRVFIIRTSPGASYQVVLNGCEETGKGFI